MTETAFETHKWSKNDYVVSEIGEQLFNQAASFFGYRYGNSPMVNDLRNSGRRKQRVYGANYREHTLKFGTIRNKNLIGCHAKATDSLIKQNVN